MADLDSTGIRALRGGRTRAAFAELLGVNAHTVYRWEQPERSAHARRPRGEVLARLQALVTTAPDPLIVPIAAAIERALDGAWHDAEAALLRAQSDRSAGVQARALAATGLALIDLLYRADGRRALAALAPARAPDAPPLALTEATIALAYSLPDGELFDLGLVHAHAQRVDELAPGTESPTAHALAAMAVANAALVGGDDDLMLRALGRIDAIAGASLPDVPALFLDQMRSYAATMAGHSELALDRLDRILAHPLVKASATLEARVAAARAMRMLDNLGDPTEALALARHARATAAAGQLAIGVHTALALRAEAEALLRLGRLDELAAVFAESDRIFHDGRFPVTIIIPVQARYLMYTQRADELDALAAKFAAVVLPSIRAVCQAYGAWLTATAIFTRGTDPEAAMAAYANAERLSNGWGFLQRDLLVAFVTAALVDGTPQQARAVLERAYRAADRRPSAWITAHLRRAEGTLLIEEGRIDEGRTLLEAAAATFIASGDRLGAAFARYGTAGFARITGSPDAEARMRDAAAELGVLGIPDPPWIDRALDRAARIVAIARAEHSTAPIDRVFADAARAPSHALSIPINLELAIQRIAVPGGSSMIVMRELVAVARELTAGPVVLEDEERTVLYGAASEVTTWLDLGTGGRRLRLGIARAIDDATLRALRVLVLVANLALQITGRGNERTRSAEMVVPDVPGLVVASAAMRRLLADVQRLAGSRATVTIGGESGAGKEVIARALHELSPRAAKPYVAFNCATVPRELFEGQLFGYRKGAFTGATSDHPGVIRAADGGTLFLDEVGELPLDIQPKLLRFLDAGEVFPLGAQKPVNVDVRVIAATNRDLAAEVAAGRFRQDLFYRLHVVPLVVPPLRDRRDDIVPLARHFARVIAAPARPPTFAPDALVAMRDHAWPGNVRELRNAVERAMAYSDDDVLSRADLSL